MNLRAQLLFRHRQALLSAKADLYDATDAERIEALQVERFNRVWARCLRDVPFYQAWAREHRLPQAIARTDDLLDFPILTKQVVVERSGEIFQNGKLTRAISTGGSLGTPARFPTSAQDADANWASLYVARGWWDIRPFDRQMLVWGHSHLFGDGFRRRIAMVKRNLADWLINARRLNAYDMSEQAIEHYVAALFTDRPVFVVGYTSVIFRLARHIERMPANRRIENLKGVILTAETASGADIDVIAGAFAAPAIVEYGGAETGVIAYSRYASDPMRLQLMWDSHIAVNDGGAIRVTTIGDRIFPLVNYDIGDTTKPAARARQTVIEFDTITGRTQDVVRLPATDGRELVISAIMFVHLLKPNPHVRSVSLQQGSGVLRIFVEGDDSLDINELTKFFILHMKNDYPYFDQRTVTLEKTQSPLKTLAGKHVLMRAPQ